MSPGLGVGIVWWPALDPLCETREGLVDVIEAEPEAFWRPWGAAYQSDLPLALGHLPQPKLLHGVGAPLGGTCGPPRGHQTSFADDVAALRPQWISEHLSFSRFHPKDAPQPVVAGFLLPPAQTTKSVGIATHNIRARREQLGVPVAFETAVNYLPPLPGEIPDGAFAAAVAELADCDILLDLHNIWCNERNGRQGVRAFCDSLPLHRVRELHVAGGEAKDGFWLDGHAGLVPSAVMDIASELVPRLPNLGAIVFEISPGRVAEVGLHAIAKNLEQLRDIWNTRGNAAATSCPATAIATLRLAPPEWERLIGGALVSPVGIAPPRALRAWWRDAAPAIELYRALWAEGRGSALVVTAPRTMRLLLHTLGPPGTRRLLHAFHRAETPGYTAIDEARAFLPFALRAAAAVPGIDDAAVADAVGLG
jgi:uncharacterized protein (UPF0276 family)